jgi:HSP20 family protein
VELHDGILTIRGEKKLERDEKKEHARYVERVFGTFVRSFSLPQNADAEKIQASFKDGVLTLRIPKREEAKPRTINIQPSK